MNRKPEDILALPSLELFQELRKLDLHERISLWENSFPRIHDMQNSSSFTENLRALYISTGSVNAVSLPSSETIAQHNLTDEDRFWLVVISLASPQAHNAPEHYLAMDPNSEYRKAIDRRNNEDPDFRNYFNNLVQAHLRKKAAGVPLPARPSANTHQAPASRASSTAAAPATKKPEAAKINTTRYHAQLTSGERQQFRSNYAFGPRGVGQTTPAFRQAILDRMEIAELKALKDYAVDVSNKPAVDDKTRQFWKEEANRIESTITRKQEANVQAQPAAAALPAQNTFQYNDKMSSDQRGQFRKEFYLKVKDDPSKRWDILEKMSLADLQRLEKSAQKIGKDPDEFGKFWQEEIVLIQGMIKNKSREEGIASKNAGLKQQGYLYTMMTGDRRKEFREQYISGTDTERQIILDNMRIPDLDRFLESATGLRYNNLTNETGHFWYKQLQVIETTLARKAFIEGLSALVTDPKIQRNAPFEIVDIHRIIKQYSSDSRQTLSELHKYALSRPDSKTHPEVNALLKSLREVKDVAGDLNSKKDEVAAIHQKLNPASEKSISVQVIKPGPN